jgi:hypothetical protein
MKNFSNSERPLYEENITCNISITPSLPLPIDTLSVTIRLLLRVWVLWSVRTLRVLNLAQSGRLQSRR